MEKKHENLKFADETNCLHGCWNPKDGFSAVKVPVFKTSTFQFDNCEQGEEFFKKNSGKPNKFGDKEGYVYSRMGNPTNNVYERRLAKLDGNEEGAVFASGMGAISSSCLAFLKSGDGMIIYGPIYGGSHSLLIKVFPNFGIKLKFLLGSDTINEEVDKYLFGVEIADVTVKNIKIIYVETPSNPVNGMTDLEELCLLRDKINNKKMEILNKKELVDDEKCIIICDNTFLGPIFQTPAKYGIDINLYSATKFLGGHSDLVAGAVTGKKSLIQKIKGMRSNLGTNSTPEICFMLLRSLETLSIRMKAQQENCLKVYEFLVDYKKKHPEVIEKILYPLSLDPNSKQFKTFKKQCMGSGSMISFCVKGGKEEAHKVIDQLKLIAIAVSLGATETLCCCPYSTTHLSIPEEEKKAFGIEPSLIRISIGLENYIDLIEDIGGALKILEKKN